MSDLTHGHVALKEIAMCRMAKRCIKHPDRLCRGDVNCSCGEDAVKGWIPEVNLVTAAKLSVREGKNLEENRKLLEDLYNSMPNDLVRYYKSLKVSLDQTQPIRRCVT